MINFQWDNDEKTVMRYTVEGDWNWNEFHKTLRRSTLRFDDVSHPVDTIIDLRKGLKLPAGAVGHLRSLGTKMHPNGVARTVIIGVDRTVQSAIGAVDRLYWDEGRVIHFAITDEDAYAVINRWRNSVASGGQAT
jgi:hypothetical protein